MEHLEYVPAIMHTFRFIVFCCGKVRLYPYPLGCTLISPGQAYDFPRVSEVNLKNMG